MSNKAASIEIETRASNARSPSPSRPPSSSLPVEDDRDEGLDDGEEGVHHPVHQPVR